MKTFVQRLSEKFTIDRSGCWLWFGSKSGNGYGRISYEGTNKLAHRVMYHETIGEIPPGMLVLHRCDVRNCVNPGHLFLGTAKDNTQDMVKKGRGARGEKHRSAKLKEKDVERIRELIVKGLRIKHISEKYQVSLSTIYSIKSGKLWAHVRITGASHIVDGQGELFT